MALAYTPPGVRVSEVVTPSVSPLLAAPANVCIVGPSQGFVQRTDLVALANEDAIALPNFPQTATLIDGSVTVANINESDTNYIENTDYTINYNTAVNEVQTVTVTATGGTFTLTYRDETTANIAEDAAAAAVESALEALGNLETADVAVTGAGGGPYTITFSGQYADQNVDTLVADGALLTGPSANVTVATAIPGGVIGTIARDSGGDIAEGETVRVTYRYIPENYYLPTRLETQSQVEDLYGPAFSDDGTISSHVSFAAAIAFENGARDLVIQALFRLEDDADPLSVKNAPTDAEIQSSTTWEQTLYALRDIDDVNVLVPAIGQSFDGLSDAEQLSILQEVRRHVRWMADEQQYVVAVVGEDSSTLSSVGQAATLRSHAETIRSADPTVSEQIVFVSPSKFTRVNPVTGSNFYVGGQFFAAGVAGLLASRSVATPITRQSVSGFTEIADPRSRTEKNTDAAEGLLVTDQIGQNVRIRHAVTLDNTATQRRELSVVRAKHRMIESIRDTIDSQIIGRVIADGNAPLIVASTVEAVLEGLRVAGDLVDYQNIQARTLTLDPTTVEVRYSYRPAFPLNYVNVVFSIDLSGGTEVVIG